MPAYSKIWYSADMENDVKNNENKPRRSVRALVGGIWIPFVWTLIGSLIMAFANRAFLNIYDIVPGGFTGLALIINGTVLPAVPAGLMSIVFNIPLFIIGWRILGNKFGFLTLCGTLFYSVFIDVLPLLLPLLNIDLNALTENAATGAPDYLLATIYGGVLFGVGYGLIIRNGSSTGGTDLLANIIQGKKPSFSFGTLLLMIDGIVVLLSGIAFGFNKALYAFITIFLSSRIADYIIDGKRGTRAYYIITDKAKELNAAISEKLQRGATALRGRGMYSGADKDVLLCIVFRTQAQELKKIVSQTDPHAFLFSSNVNETYGEGFKPLKI